MSKKSESTPKLDGKGIAMIIIAIGAIYILATNILSFIIALFLFGIAVLIVLYFILPILGISGLAGLAALIGLGKR